MAAVCTCLLSPRDHLGFSHSMQHLKEIKTSSQYFVLVMRPTWTSHCHLFGLCLLTTGGSAVECNISVATEWHENNQRRVDSISRNIRSVELAVRCPGQIHILAKCSAIKGHMALAVFVGIEHFLNFWFLEFFWIWDKRHISYSIWLKVITLLKINVLH